MRKSWDEYFWTIAHAVAERSTCPRRQVGAVLVRDKQIKATGYNGAPKGIPSCDEIGCLLKHDHCIRTVHAEVNALLRSTPWDQLGAELYVTDTPCWPCANAIANTDIMTIHVSRPYRPDPAVLELFQARGICLVERQNRTP